MLKREFYSIIPQKKFKKMEVSLLLLVALSSIVPWSLSNPQEYSRTEVFDRVIFKRSTKFLGKDRKDIKYHGRSDLNAQHKIIIAVKQSNLDVLQTLVNDISDPDSENFGRVMTREDIALLTNHATSSDYIFEHLKTVFSDSSSKVTRSAYGEYISGL